MASKCSFPSAFLYMERFCLSLESVHKCGLFAWKIGYLYENNHFDRFGTVDSSAVFLSIGLILDGRRIYWNIFRRIIGMAKICISANRIKIEGYFERHFSVFGNNCYLLIYCMDSYKKYPEYLLVTCV